MIQNDRNLEIKFLKVLKCILGKTFILKNMDKDYHEATDLCGINFSAAIRLRRYKYYLTPGYREEFTIREKRYTGLDTEAKKVNQGYSSVLLYGFVNEAETNIIQYFLGDMDIFRATKAKPKIIKNSDNSSDFAVYKLDQFPDGFILDSYGFPERNPMEGEHWYQDMLVDNFS